MRLQESMWINDVHSRQMRRMPSVAISWNLMESLGHAETVDHSWLVLFLQANVSLHKLGSVSSRSTAVPATS